MAEKRCCRAPPQAIPTDQTLWDDLMLNKTSAGVPLRVYEQDWMYNEWQACRCVW